MDETAIEIGESEEGLYIFDLPQSGPFLTLAMSIESLVGDNTNLRYSTVSA